MTDPASLPPDAAAQAVTYAEHLIGDRFFWSLSRGKTAPDEPLWCFTVWDAGAVEAAERSEDLCAIAMALHDDPLRAVMDVALDLGLVPERAS